VLTDRTYRRLLPPGDSEDLETDQRSVRNDGVLADHRRGRGRVPEPDHEVGEAGAGGRRERADARRRKAARDSVGPARILHTPENYSGPWRKTTGGIDKNT